MLLPPLNFNKWLEEHSEKLQPPVNNYLLYKGNDTIIMVVGGPNKRTDYHINETEVLMPFNPPAHIHTYTGIHIKQTSWDSNTKITNLCKFKQEWFYQLKGDLLIKVVEDGEFKDIVVKEGSMFLLPRFTLPYAYTYNLAKVPHNPIRYKDTIGLVVERVRLPHHIDKLRWYCEKDDCHEIVYEESFHCVDLGTQLKPIIEKFHNDDQLRTCKKCGHLNSHK
ncbi:RmlC-like cupin domain-containing protein [Mycotypha africana]|uniref:RmlC-like cupin domain-containing protein n=1 Tax=Mycotypha africana TaxID=64632 RepID=UPI002301B08D|nr:RmlC-like cupin domain-containing protein [Mycotypha africana]KAI8967693.1 RmlC-like cupin domain-containing protein [Mycotypha africana]